MNRVAYVTTLIASTLIITGCAVTVPQVSHAPQERPSHAMPEVTVAPATPAHRPLSSDELRALRDGSVSGAVKSLTDRGYTSVLVEDATGTSVPQAQWDYLGVVAVDEAGGNARVIIG